MKPEYKSTYYRVEVSKGGTETKVTVEVKPVELLKETAKEKTETVKSEAKTKKSTETEIPKGKRKKQIVEK